MLSCRNMRHAIGGGETCLGRVTSCINVILSPLSSVILSAAKNLSLREHETLRGACPEPGRRAQGDMVPTVILTKIILSTPLSPQSWGDCEEAGGHPRTPAKGALPLVESPLKLAESPERLGLSGGGLGVIPQIPFSPSPGGEGRG